MPEGEAPPDPGLSAYVTRSRGVRLLLSEPLAGSAQATCGALKVDGEAGARGRLVPGPVLDLRLKRVQAVGQGRARSELGGGLGGAFREEGRAVDPVEQDHEGRGVDAGGRGPARARRIGVGDAQTRRSVPADGAGHGLGPRGHGCGDVARGAEEGEVAGTTTAGWPA